MMHRWHRAAILSLALLVFLVSTQGILADEGTVKDIRRLAPDELAGPSKHVRNLLSGRPWLITNGLDPALGMGLKSRRDIAPSNSLRTVQPQAGGGGAALVPFRDPSAKFSRNILIPEDFSSLTFQTEPSIAINPKDPDHLLVGMIDYNFTDMVSYTSIDGGTTWEGPSHAKYPRNDVAAAGDPIVAFDRQGNAYYAFISLNVQEYTIGPILGQAVVSAISMNSSSDGGFTWENPVQAANSRIITTPLPSGADLRPRGRIETGFLDKPWMTVGPHPTDPGRDVIYILYTKFIDITEVFWIDELPFLGAPALETVLEMVKSEDGGLTWTEPIEVSPRAQYTILMNAITQDQPSQGTAVRQVVQGPALTVADDGTLYVGWLDTTDDDSFKGLAEIYVRRSDDAGETFGSARRVSGFLEPGFQARNAPFRSWASAFPKLATGLDDEVYVLWGAIPNDNPEDDGDVFMVGSTDRGETWSRRKKVNDDDTDHFQFFPELTVGPDGTLHAMWGDLRDDPDEVNYHIYYASSENGGDTWSVNSRVTDFPSNPHRAFPGGRFIGDYFGIEATDEDVYMVWADSRLGEFGPANQKIGFARQRLMPSPSIFISPPSGPAGQDIIVQGFNFQAHRDVFIEVAGVIVSTTRTQDEGRFTTQIFVPISGEGAHTVRAFDSSGNVAGSSYFMDFGFDSIEQVTDLITDLSKQIEALSTSGALSSDQNGVPLSATGQSAQDGDDRSSSALLFTIFGGVIILVLGTGGLVAALIRRGTR